MLCLHDSIDFPSAFLGAIKAGIVPVSIDAVLSTRDYDVMLRDSRAQVLVVSQALLGTFQPRKTNAGLDLAPFVYTPRLLHHEIQTGSIHATPVAIVHNGVSSN